MKHVICNFCGRDETRPVNTGPDLLLGIAGEFKLVQCINCSLIYQNPQLEPDELAPHYPDDYLPFQEMERPDEQSRVEEMSQNYNMQRQINKVLHYHSTPGKLLDIGCATGTFLGYMQPYGFECYGIEPGENAAEFGRQTYGVDILTGTLEDSNFPDDMFDMVTLWDVLEHVADPRETLLEVARILKPNGTLIVSLPNPTAFDATLFGAYWVGWERPRHLTLYSPKLLQALLAETGFSLTAKESFAGRWALTLMSIEFWLKSKGMSAERYAKWYKLLYSVPMRLLTMPYFLLIEKLNRTTTITYFGKRNPS